MRNLAPRDRAQYWGAMSGVFDIGDHARLPWRFFGARRAGRLAGL